MTDLEYLDNNIAKLSMYQYLGLRRLIEEDGFKLQWHMDIGRDSGLRRWFISRWYMRVVFHTSLEGNDTVIGIRIGKGTTDWSDHVYLSQPYRRPVYFYFDKVPPDVRYSAETALRIMDKAGVM